MVPAIGSWPTMQEDPTPRTDHPAEGVNLPLPGIQTAHDMGEAEAHLETPDADLESNELHAGGQDLARAASRRYSPERTCAAP